LREEESKATTFPPLNSLKSAESKPEGTPNKVASSKYTSVEGLLTAPTLLEGEYCPLTDDELNISLESSVVSSKVREIEFKHVAEEL